MIDACSTNGSNQYTKCEDCEANGTKTLERKQVSMFVLQLPRPLTYRP